jgi:nucleoside-diphosphate-sugar epimerase
MNILLTGAGGFIGSHLSKHLSIEHKVYRVFSDSNNYNTPYSLVVNLTDKGSVYKIFSDSSKWGHIDAIIHLASKMASPEQSKDVDLLRDNIIISENIVNITKLLKPDVLINFSSMAVYPNVSGNFSEESIPDPRYNPDCLYGLSKYCSEVIIDFFLGEENLRILHLRISQVHGEGMRQDRIMPVMLKELRENNTITLYGNGKRTSNFIDINKLVYICKVFLKNDAFGIYNVGDQNISYSKLAKKLSGEYGNENTSICNVLGGRQEKFVLNTRKLDSILEKQ